MAIGLLAGAVLAAPSVADEPGEARGERPSQAVQVGPRPFYLVTGMDAGPMKSKLESCKNGPFHRTDFSIGHRGAALPFPEHTKESYEAGARMGAGIVECDVTFTADGALVCRHAERDLHTTRTATCTSRSTCWRGRWACAASSPTGRVP